MPIRLARRIRSLLVYKSQVDSMVKYIQNQETHHAKRTFRDEYVSFLKLFGIEYDERYVFREME